MNETLREKMLDTCWFHFTSLLRGLVGPVDPETIKKINDEIEKTRQVMDKIKEVFAK